MWTVEEVGKGNPLSSVCLPADLALENDGGRQVVHKHMMGYPERGHTVSVGTEPIAFVRLDRFYGLPCG